MKVILSIKPEFAFKIFDGTKRYEFRRSLFKNKDVKSVVVYASAPVSKVIGEFEIDRILYDDLDSLWADTKKESGISKEYYYQYFTGKNRGYAIRVKRIRKYDKHLCIRKEYGLNPPQSFAYVR